MDYDLAVFTECEISRFRDVEVDGLELLDSRGKLKIFKEYPNDARSLEDIVVDFIERVSAFDDDPFKAASIVQVAIYYPAQDFATFTTRFSDNCISFLSNKKLGIEVCIYPCSETKDQEQSTIN